MKRGLKYCVNCKHWYCYKFDEQMEKSFDATVEGECHRYPPNMPIVANSSGYEDVDVKDLIIALYRQTPMVGHPYTYSNEWCGEFEYADDIRDPEGYDAEWSDE